MPTACATRFVTLRSAYQTTADNRRETLRSIGYTAAPGTVCGPEVDMLADGPKSLDGSEWPTPTVQVQ